MLLPRITVSLLFSISRCLCADIESCISFPNPAHDNSLSKYRYATNIKKIDQIEISPQEDEMQSVVQLNLDSLDSRKNTNSNSLTHSDQVESLEIASSAKHSKSILKPKSLSNNQKGLSMKQVIFCLSQNKLREYDPENPDIGEYIDLPVDIGDCNSDSSESEDEVESLLNLKFLIFPDDCDENLLDKINEKMKLPSITNSECSNYIKIENSPEYSIPKQIVNSEISLSTDQKIDDGNRTDSESPKEALVEFKSVECDTLSSENPKYQDDNILKESENSIQSQNL